MNIFETRVFLCRISGQIFFILLPVNLEGSCCDYRRKKFVSSCSLTQQCSKRLLFQKRLERGCFGRIARARYTVSVQRILVGQSRAETKELKSWGLPGTWSRLPIANPTVSPKTLATVPSPNHSCTCNLSALKLLLVIVFVAHPLAPIRSLLLRSTYAVTIQSFSNLPVASPGSTLKLDSKRPSSRVPILNRSHFSACHFRHVARPH